MKVNIRLLYLYLFSFVGLLMAVIGCMRLVDLGLKVFVFKEADRYVYYPQPITSPERPEEIKFDEEGQKTAQEQETKRQRQREIAGALSMIIVGSPLYLYHWKTIQKENKS